MNQQKPIMWTKKTTMPIHPIGSSTLFCMLLLWHWLWVPHLALAPLGAAAEETATTEVAARDV
jgi:hypothetical protein